MTFVATYWWLQSLDNYMHTGTRKVTFEPAAKSFPTIQVMSTVIWQMTLSKRNIRTMANFNRPTSCHLMTLRQSSVKQIDQEMMSLNKWKTWPNTVLKLWRTNSEDRRTFWALRFSGMIFWLTVKGKCGLLKSIRIHAYNSQGLCSQG